MRRILFLILVLTLTTATHAGAAVTYTDRLNRTVMIPTPVERAVFLQMHELLPALDIWDKVVGLASYAFHNEVIRAARPDIETIPSVGSGWDVNIEAILKLRPDLVITWAAKPEFVRFMEEKGLRVIAVYPESIEELYGVMRLLGTLFGREERMETARAEMEAVFSLIRERESRRVKEKRQKMIYLGGQPNSVSGALGINNDLINLIGGVNPAETIRERSPLVSLEQIVVWNPEVIFIWGNARYTAQDIIGNPQWRHIKAIQKKRVYKLPEWTTWGPRLPLVALYMAQKAYPEDFADIEFATVADDLYRQVFHISYQPKAAP